MPKPLSKDSFDLLDLDPGQQHQPRQEELWQENEASPDDSIRQEAVENVTKEVPKRFSVRCQGRWRVRNAPSLGSKVISTIANGTVVIGIDAPGQMPIDGGVHQTISSLWVRVLRLEAQEPQGVSDIKRDFASGGALFCLRRNALGYGLYEIGIESLDGPLITLPESMEAELRCDAQQAAIEVSEEVSLTWKLLGAAESFGRFFTQMSMGQNEGGINEEVKDRVRMRPEEAFEIRQQEQLKKAAGTLKKSVQKIISNAGATSGDMTAGLPKEIGRRFQRLRTSLVASAVTPLVVAVQKPSQASQHVASPCAASAPLAAAAATDLVQTAEGNLADLEQFVELCACLERNGAWPELSNELRQEFSNFSLKHTKDLEDYARTLGKASGNQNRRTVSEGDINYGGTNPIDAPRRGPMDISARNATNGYPATGFGGLPLLPPPPRPATGVGKEDLI